MRVSILTALAGASVLLASTASAAPDPQATLDKMLAGRVAGEPVRCIPQPGRATTVIPKIGIVFDVGGVLYLNKPAQNADQLRWNTGIITNTSTGQRLCDVDSVRLFDNTNSQAGFMGAVILGPFVPYKRAG